MATISLSAEDLIIRAVIEIMAQSIGGLNISTNFGVLWITEGGVLAEGGELPGVSLEVCPFLSAPLCFLATMMCTASSSRPFF